MVKRSVYTEVDPDWCTQIKRTQRRRRTSVLLLCVSDPFSRIESDPVLDLYDIVGKG